MQLDHSSGEEVFTSAVSDAAKHPRTFQVFFDRAYVREGKMKQR